MDKNPCVALTDRVLAEERSRRDRRGYLARLRARYVDMPDGPRRRILKRVFTAMCYGMSPAMARQTILLSSTYQGVRGDFRRTRDLRYQIQE